MGWLKSSRTAAVPPLGGAAAMVFGREKRRKSEEGWRESGRASLASEKQKKNRRVPHTQCARNAPPCGAARASWPPSAR